jgi:endonuclease IV
MKGPLLGLKLWSTDAGLIPEVTRVFGEGLFDYIELLIVPGTDPAPFRDAGLPTVIHVTSERFGVNIADPAARDLSRALLASSLEWADLLGSEFLILHPGHGRPEDAGEFLDRVDDRRLLIENMPKTGMAGERMVGYDPAQVSALRRGRFGFCLDLNHAIKASISLKKDYRALVREFLALGPSVFHIADGSLGSDRDEHLPLGAGEYDISFLKRCITGSGGGRVTFETPRLQGSLAEDLANRERFLSA